MNITRREWALAAACWADLAHAQPAPSDKFLWFNASDAAEIKAIASQIIPEDGGPGADSTNVILFIDRSLGGFDQDKQELYKSGLAQAQAKRTELFPGSTSIASLPDTQKIALLKAIEKTDFFQQVRLHTILGFFGQPAGIKFLGVEHQMHFEPPFGYYDVGATK